VLLQPPTDVDVLGQGSGSANFNNAAQASGLNIQGTFHVHPMGDATGTFVQPPSGADLNNAVNRSNNMGISGNNYVLAAGNNTVYIYKNINGTGKVISTFPLNRFFQLQ
jgi:type II secretory pathway component GspD/PulD (secretin)